MGDPSTILATMFERADTQRNRSFIPDDDIRRRVNDVCRQTSNRACPRLLIACLLAKIDRPDIDPRKPYTEIGDEDAFSGRSYDEKYVYRFINENSLPLNSTTAFLTPAFRNLNRPLTPDIELVGRPKQVYTATVQLLDDVYNKRVSAEDLLAEIIRILLLMREEGLARIRDLLAKQAPDEALPLSAEEILHLIEQHLKCRNSSRLPVLVVAAAYRAVEQYLNERILPLQAHNAADKQTGSLGDVEICLKDDNHIVTVYEMKARRVLIDDIDRAIEKIQRFSHNIHNYIIITTDIITDEVKSYATKCYEQTGGTEIVVLDCIGFLRHFYTSSIDHDYSS